MCSLQAHLEELLSGISGDLLGWAPGPRTKAAKLLRLCLLLWESTIIDHLQRLLPLLVKVNMLQVKLHRKEAVHMSKRSASDMREGIEGGFCPAYIANV